MHAMTKGMEPPREEASDAEREPFALARAGYSTVAWVHDGPVCVTIVNSPPPRPGRGVCRCPACHGSLQVDLAEGFLGGD